MGKKEYLVEELGEGTVKLMKTIKKAIDLLGLFNPGKVSIWRSCHSLTRNPEC
jgi:D-lactate dehydrogenase (cytochrome)